MTRRSFAEHIVLVSAFATKVDELSPDAWARLREHCRPLSGTTPEALFRRSQLFAKPHSHVPIPADAPLYLRALPGLLRGFNIGIGLGYEVVTSAFPSTIEPPWTRHTSSDKPHFDRMIDAHSMVEHAMERHGVRVPSVATAVRAASNAVLRHDWLPPAMFQDVYQWVAPEIPYALVEAAAPVGHTTGN